MELHMIIPIWWGKKVDFEKKIFGESIYITCPECNKDGEFFEVTPIETSTLYSIIPLKKKEVEGSFFECPNCHNHFNIETSMYYSSEPTPSYESTQPHIYHKNETPLKERNNIDSKALAIKLDEMPEEQRASMGDPVQGNMTYKEWFKTQPESVQQGILGKKRWRYWAEKGLSLSDLIDEQGRRLNLKQLSEKYGPLD